MKIKTVKYILSVLLTIFAFTSCDKNELAISEIQKSTKTDILTFATQEDFDKTLTKVNAMTKEERLAWEKEQGFKSFGTICDEFYATIQPENFKSLEEVQVFVARNSDKIEFYTSSDGETYCVTKDFKNPMRYIINQNMLYVIGTSAYKRIGDNTYSSNISNLNALSNAKTLEDINRIDICEDLMNDKKSKIQTSIVTEDDAHGECVIKASKWYRSDDTYRVHAWIKTETAGYNTCYWTTLQIKNFTLSVGIWWFIEASVNFTYNFVITDNNNNSFSRNVTDGGWITSSNSSPRYSFTTPYISNISTPYYTSYYCTVTNTVTDSDGTGHCTATMSK